MQLCGIVRPGGNAAGGGSGRQGPPPGGAVAESYCMRPCANTCSHARFLVGVAGERRRDMIYGCGDGSFCFSGFFVKLG